jgi:ferritin
MNKNTITITLDADTLDTIRKDALKNYRTVNKHISYLIDMGMNASNTDVYEIADFLQDVADGNLDEFNTMSRANKLLKEINKEQHDER